MLTWFWIAGGGTFVGSTGQVDWNNDHVLPSLNLPEDALPSAEERDRMFESITLSKSE